jgi:hypothetical protein
MELRSIPIYFFSVLDKMKKVVRLILLPQMHDLICLDQRSDIPLRRHRRVADLLYR